MKCFYWFSKWRILSHAPDVLVFSMLFSFWFLHFVFTSFNARFPKFRHQMHSKHFEAAKWADFTFFSQRLCSWFFQDSVSNLKIWRRLTKLRTPSCRQCEGCKYWETPSWLAICPTLYWLFLLGTAGLRGDTYSRITTDVLADSTRRQHLKSSWKRFSDSAQNSVPRTTLNTVASTGGQKSSIREIVKTVYRTILNFQRKFCSWSHGAVVN